jgi:hypothetical protein
VVFKRCIIEEKMRPCFYEFQRIERKEIVGAEIGVHRGIHAWDMLCGLDSLVMLHLVDPYLEYSAYKENRDEHKEEALNRLESKRDRVKWHLETSEEASHKFSTESLDFVYLDGDHSYEAVKKDIRLWWPKVKQNGMLAGHDFDIIGHPDVHKAVLEFACNNGYKLNIHTVTPFPHRQEAIHSDWWVFKCTS